MSWRIISFHLYKLLRCDVMMTDDWRVVCLLALVLLQRRRPAVSLSTSVTIIWTDVEQIIKRHMESDVTWTRPIEFLLDFVWCCILWWIYDSIATVGEIRVRWRADFQSGSRVLKSRSEPFLIYIYGIQCDFMPKSCWKHSNFENR